MIKIEFNCPKCGKEHKIALDLNDGLYFTSCECETYFRIINRFKSPIVQEIEKEDFYWWLDNLEGDEND